MLPFQNSFTQYMADIYASTSYYQSVYHYPPLDNYWNANYEQLPLHNISPPQPLVKIEEPTRTKEKIKKAKPKVVEESSVSCNGVQEQSDSPQLKSRQKEGRNINSNIFHQMLKSIRNDDIFDKMLDRVFATYELLLNKKEFLEMLQKKIGKLNPYVSTAKMRSFLNVPSRPKVGYIKQNTQLDYDFLKVLRMTSRYYLTYIHPLYVYNKLKLQKKSKRFHLWGIRTIITTITN